MAKKVYVTSAQKHAAQMVVKRTIAAGRTVSASVRKIAEAETVLTPEGVGSSAPSRLASHAARVRRFTQEATAARSGRGRRRK